MLDAELHIDMALKDADPARALVLAQVATAEATLALAAEVAALRESFGQCDHGYTICPYCIRNAMEGIA